MIISYPKRSILSLFFLLLLLLSLLNLSKLDQEISIKKQTINDTPVTIFEPKKDKIVELFQYKSNRLHAKIKNKNFSILLQWSSTTKWA